MKRLLLAAPAGHFFCAGAFAEYPEKPITIVVPFAAGGPTDKVARDLAEALRKPLNNQSIIIDNVGGAGGTLGAAKVARAAPDALVVADGTSCRHQIADGAGRAALPLARVLFDHLAPGGG